MSPEYQDAMTMLKNSPLAIEGLPILKESIAEEVFICAGPRVPAFIAAVEQVQRISQAQSFAQAFTDPVADPTVIPQPIIDALLANQEELRMPSVLIGFKLGTPEAANEFLDKWRKKLGEWE